MNKFLSVVVAGLIAGSLSVSAFAADAAKPATASTVTTAKVAEKAGATKVAAKKDTGIKASVKKLFAPSAKKTDVKVK